MGAIPSLSQQSQARRRRPPWPPLPEGMSDGVEVGGKTRMRRGNGPPAKRGRGKEGMHTPKKEQSRDKVYVR